jgi:hypothetical protein
MNIGLRPVSIGETAQCARPDQNAEQARSADHAVLHRGQVEFLADQRQGDAGHEHDQSLEELAGDRQPPNSPLHAGHRRAGRNRSIGPLRRLVDVALHGVYACGRHALRHGASFPRPGINKESESAKP